MNKLEKSPYKGKKLLKEATDKLRNHEFEESYKLIVKSLGLNPHAPEPHNLLGIWFEIKGNKDTARKHYRAAYALDPTYKPACENLERVCTFFPNWSIPYDFGDEFIEGNTNEKRHEKNARQEV
ncbi:MAG: hypothetical protein K6T81_06200 [Alicyclobacillus macrosporangiidus]|uniref:tetratricopeptide repeat protein n=1 Tax=Alicyclobacillus macrosporangiidus TaxID=392015 RepID=UPI0026EB0771|nr:hypothetical protein [Alicyclobacillus macrosporangiidus]MCL6598317.1 hypothetical protein [Alicyclobacillus macrosporangiidus]